MFRTYENKRCLVKWADMKYTKQHLHYLAIREWRRKSYNFLPYWIRHVGKRPGTTTTECATNKKQPDARCARSYNRKSAPFIFPGKWEIDGSWVERRWRRENERERERRRPQWRVQREEKEWERSENAQMTMRWRCARAVGHKGRMNNERPAAISTPLASRILSITMSAHGDPSGSTLNLDFRSRLFADHCQ